MQDKLTHKEALPEHIKIEYVELSRLYTEMVRARFTVLGFYIASAAITLREHSISITAALVVLTIGAWVIEIRNRYLLILLRRRGQYIERTYWGYIIPDQQKTDGPFTAEDEIPLFSALEINRPIPFLILGQLLVVPDHIRRSVLHSNAIDLIFSLIGVVAVAKFLFLSGVMTISCFGW